MTEERKREIVELATRELRRVRTRAAIHELRAPREAKGAQLVLGAVAEHDPRQLPLSFNNDGGRDGPRR